LKSQLKIKLNIFWNLKLNLVILFYKMVEDNSYIINSVTVKRAMSEEYYQIWSMDIELLLEEKELDAYIHEKRIKIVCRPESRMKDNKKLWGTTGMYFW